MCNFITCGLLVFLALKSYAFLALKSYAFLALKSYAFEITTHTKTQHFFPSYMVHSKPMYHLLWTIHNFLQWGIQGWSLDIQGRQGVFKQKSCLGFLVKEYSVFFSKGHTQNYTCLWFCQSWCNCRCKKILVCKHAKHIFLFPEEPPKQNSYPHPTPIYI